MSNLSGEAFLIAYIVALVLCIRLESLSRRFLEPPRQPVVYSSPPGIYSLAYLTGGQARCMLTAAAKLARQGVPFSQRTDDPALANAGFSPALPPEAHAVEHYTACRFASRFEAATAAAHSNPSFPLTVLQSDLIARGLLWDERSPYGMLRRLAGIAPLLLLLGVGGLRLKMGITNDKPVVFLVLLLVITVVFCLKTLFRDPDKTVAGIELEKDLRQRHSALESTVPKRQHEVSEADWMLAVGLVRFICVDGDTV